MNHVSAKNTGHELMKPAGTINGPTEAASTLEKLRIDIFFQKYM